MKFHSEPNLVGHIKNVGTQQHADSAEQVQQSNLGNLFCNFRKLRNFKLRWSTLPVFPYPLLRMYRLERWTRLVIPTPADFQPVSDLYDAMKALPVQIAIAPSCASFLKRATDLRLVGLFCEFSKLLAASTEISTERWSERCRNLPGSPRQTANESPSKVISHRTDISMWPVWASHPVEGNHHG